MSTNNSSSKGRVHILRQAITGSSDAIVLTEPLKTNFDEIWIKIKQLS